MLLVKENILPCRKRMRSLHVAKNIKAFPFVSLSKPMKESAEKKLFSHRKHRSSERFSSERKTFLRGVAVSVEKLLQMWSDNIFPVSTQVPNVHDVKVASGAGEQGGRRSKGCKSIKRMKLKMGLSTHQSLQRNT